MTQQEQRQFTATMQMIVATGDRPYGKGVWHSGGQCHEGVVYFTAVCRFGA